MRVEDPEGNRLSCVLLQIIERDGDRPRVLRLLRDDETVDLAAAAVDGNTVSFLAVWATTDAVRAERGLSALMEDCYKLREISKERDEICKSLQNDVNFIRQEHVKINAELEEKTAALRQLQRERDPTRIEREVADRVQAATRELEARLSVVKQENHQLRRDADELRAAKRRLRDALDRKKS